MKAVTKITFFDDNGEKFFGEGPARLLHAIQEHGSLRSAAMSMNMAYTKALRILRNAERVLGCSLTSRAAGGRDGGGSRLTPEGKEWLTRYEAYRDACIRANEELYAAFFPRKPDPPRLGCVIMASGMGRRFGGNKLMAPFQEQPMLCRVLDATEGIFASRVVVTRHEDVAALCRARNLRVILHDLPSRSDTVRLGLEAIGDMDGCMFCSGDQPLLRRETVAALKSCAASDPSSIWRTAHDGTPGAPVLFPAWTFPELLSLPEGKGGSHVIKSHPDRVCLMNVSDPLELKDVDSPEDLQTLQSI